MAGVFRNLVNNAKKFPSTRAKRKRKKVNYNLSNMLDSPKGDEEFYQERISENDNEIYESEEITLDEKINPLFVINGKGINFMFTGNFKEKLELQRKVYKNKGRILSESKLGEKKSMKKYDRTILVANKPITTFKYLLGLIYNIPLVHYKWVMECIEENRLIFPIPEKYLLERTSENEECDAKKEVINENSIKSDNKNIFQGNKFFLMLKKKEERIWRVCIQNCGGRIIRNAKDCDYLVCNEPTEEILRDSSKNDYFVITTEYVKNSILINKKISMKEFNRKKISWDREDFLEMKNGKNHFSDVIIGKEKISLNDVVELFPDETSNLNVKFAQIVDLYENFRGKKEFEYKSFIKPDDLKELLEKKKYIPKKNEMILSEFTSKTEISSIKGNYYIFPFTVPEKMGFFCTKSTDMSDLKNIEKQQFWNEKEFTLDHFWNQPRPESSGQEEFFSFAVIGNEQFFLNQWIRVSASHEGEVKDIVGKIVEMSNDTKVGKTIFLKRGIINQETNELRELDEKELIQIEINKIFNICSLKLRQKDGKINSMNRDENHYIPVNSNEC